MAIQIMFGDEPYFLSKYKNELFSKINYPDFNISIYESFEEAAYDSCTTYPVMEEERVVFIDADKLSALDTSFFKKYLEKPAEFTHLLILARNVDKKLKIYKELSTKKLIKEVNKLENTISLKKEIQGFLEEQHGSITKEALEELIQRENYLDNEAVNLISITNDLLSMLNIDKNISLDMVKEYVRDNAVDNVFALAKLILSKNAAALRKEISLISSDQAIPTLALLLREYRIGYKASFVPLKEIGTRYASFYKMPKEQLLAGIEICTKAMEEIKEGVLDAKVALTVTVGKLLHLSEN